MTPQEHPWLIEEDEEAADRRLAMVIGLFLIHELHSKAAVEDCLMAGRHDCDWLVQGHM